MRAFVLRRKTYAESDLILDFLKEDGTVTSGFARYALRSKRRFPHQFHWTAIYDLELGGSSQGLSEVKRCDLLEYEPAFGFDEFVRWSVALEFMSRDRESQFNFLEIENLFRALSKKQGRDLFHRFFVRQMEQHGLRPQLEDCLVCHLPIGDREINFSISDGGVVHQTCKRSLNLSVPALNFLRGIPMILSPADIRLLDQVTIPFLTSQLGLELKSLSFLHRTSSQVSSLGDVPAQPMPVDSRIGTLDPSVL